MHTPGRVVAFKQHARMDLPDEGVPRTWTTFLSAMSLASLATVSSRGQIETLEFFQPTIMCVWRLRNLSGRESHIASAGVG